MRKIKSFQNVGFGNIESVARGPCPEEDLFPLNRFVDQRFFMQRLAELLEQIPFGCRVEWEELPHLKDSSIPALSALYHQWSQGVQGSDPYIKDYLEHAWDLAPAIPNGPVFSSMVVCPVNAPSSSPLMTFYVDLSPWREEDSIRGVNIVFKHCVVSQSQNDWAQHFFASWAAQRDVEQRPCHLSAIKSEKAYARALGVPAIRAVLEAIREQAFDFLLCHIAVFSNVPWKPNGAKPSPHRPAINNTALLATLRAQNPDVGSVIVRPWGTIAPSPEDACATTDAIYTGFTVPSVTSFQGMARMTALCVPDCTGDFFGFRRVGVKLSCGESGEDPDIFDYAMVGSIYGPKGDPLLYLALPFAF